MKKARLLTPLPFAEIWWWDTAAILIDTAFMETEARKILKGNGYRANVKIFKDLKPFLDRLDSMNEHKESLEEGIKFRPDERYPELSRNELIRHTILAICL